MTYFIKPGTQLIPVRYELLTTRQPGDHLFTTDLTGEVGLRMNLLWRVRSIQRWNVREIGSIIMKPGAPQNYELMTSVYVRLPETLTDLAGFLVHHLQVFDLHKQSP
jgi:hypothetical protein